MTKSRTQRQAGFSLIELMVVAMIMMGIAIVAMPNMIGVIATSRLRSSMSSLSGLVQEARSKSVRENVVYSIRYTQILSEPFAYIKPASSTAALATSDPQVGMGKQATSMSSPTGTGAPPALDGATLWGGIPNPVSTEVSFNPRGIPCAYNSGTGACPTNVGFVYYFSFQPPFGGNRWAAISVSPAGRVKTWYWNGTAWSN